MDLLRPGQLFLVALLVLALTSCSTVVTALVLGSLAYGVQVQIPGLDESRASAIGVSGLSILGGEREFRRFATGEAGLVWQTERTLLRTIRVRISRKSLEAAQGIGIALGPVDCWFPREEVLARWRQLPSSAEMLVLESPPRQSDLGAGVSIRQFLLNWGETTPGAGELSVLLRLLSWPLLFTLGLTLLAFAARSFWAASSSRAWLLGMDADKTGVTGALESHPENVRWFVAGLVALLLAFGWLEWTEPRFFTQDDNRVMFLPNVLAACRAVFRGEFPSFNASEYLGCPRVDVGNFALTYPPLYLCYAIARWLLGDECLCLEVWVWLHLLLGYVTCYWFAREVRLRPALSAAAALSFVTSGYMLVIGRAWIGVSPVAFWLPLLMISVVRLQQDAQSRRWIVMTGVSIGAFFHDGNGQFWAYSIVPFGFAVLIVMSGELLTRERLARLASAGLLALALCAPLLLPQMAWVSRMERQGGIGTGILSGIAYLVLPYRLAEAVPSLKPDWPAPAKMSLHSGSLLTALGLLAAALLAVSLPAAANKGALLRRNVWPACALLTFLLALGQEGFLWGPMSALPGFSSFSFPIKFMPYLSLFLVISGGVFLERILSRTGRLVSVERLLFAGIVLLTFDQVSLPVQCWTHWSIRLPYERLDGLLSRRGEAGLLDANHRFLPMAPRWSARSDMVWSMFESLPTYYGQLSIDGYSPFLWGSPENVRVSQRMIARPIATLKAYGVKWILQHQDYKPPDSSEDPTVPQIGKCSQLDSPALLAQVRSHASIAARFGAVTVWKLPHPAPLAFVTSKPEAELPIVFESDGATVDTSSLTKSASVVINVLMRPAMRAMADGQRLEVRSDEWDRIVVDVPAGCRQLRVQYRPPWEIYLAVAFALGLLAAAVGALGFRRAG